MFQLEPRQMIKSILWYSPNLKGCVCGFMEKILIFLQGPGSDDIALLKVDFLIFLRRVMWCYHRVYTRGGIRDRHYW